MYSPVTTAVTNIFGGIKIDIFSLIQVVASVAEPLLYTYY